MCVLRENYYVYLLIPSAHSLSQRLGSVCGFPPSLCDALASTIDASVGGDGSACPLASLPRPIPAGASSAPSAQHATDRARALWLSALAVLHQQWRVASLRAALEKEEGKRSADLLTKPADAQPLPLPSTTSFSALSCPSSESTASPRSATSTLLSPGVGGAAAAGVEQPRTREGGVLLQPGVDGGGATATRIVDGEDGAPPPHRPTVAAAAVSSPPGEEGEAGADGAPALPDDAAYLLRLYSVEEEEGGGDNGPVFPHASSATSSSSGSGGGGGAEASREDGSRGRSSGVSLGRALFAHYRSALGTPSSSISAVDGRDGTGPTVSLHNWLQFLADAGAAPSLPSLPASPGGGSARATQSCEDRDPLGDWPPAVLRHARWQAACGTLSSQRKAPSTAAKAAPLPLCAQSPRTRPPPLQHHC